MEKIKMQAPKGAGPEANIMGHAYDIPKNGKITVVNPDHIPTLKRHGFIEDLSADSPEEIDAKIEAMDEKEDLVTFIEERGGEADDTMSFKKLRRLAREAAAGKDEE